MYYPQTKSDQRKAYTGSTLIHELSLCCLTALFLFVLGIVLLGLNSNRGLANLVFILTIVITFIILKEYARRLSFAQMKVRLILILDAVTAACQLVGLLLLVVFTTPSSAKIFVVTGVAVRAISISVWLIRTREQFVIRMDRVYDFRRNWLLGKWMS